MPPLSLSLLGPPRTELDGQQIKINRRKAAALLAYLAVTKESHSRDALAAMLWPEASQARARAALRSALWTLNKTAIADWLVLETEIVSLRTSAAEGGSSGAERGLNIDVDRFNDLLEAAQDHAHAPTEPCATCLDSLSQAVSLYQNDFMAGFTLPDAPAFDEWQFFQANSLRQKLALALESLIGLHRAQGQSDEAISFARRYAALDPLHEPAQRTLMQLYAEAGQKSAALRQYEICRETLHDELALEPSAETKALHKRIRSGSYLVEDELEQGHATAAEPDASGGSQEPAAANPHNLPPDSTPFIGREQELTRVAAFLKDQTTRLLTIVGPGGIGKTRLALAAAKDQVTKEIFPDGIYFVSLAPLSDVAAIVPAIAEAIGYPFQNDHRTPQQQLLDYLSQKSLLLLLDNLEHLLFKHQSDGAVVVVELLQHAAQLTVLTTSRERLNLFEEQLYPLQGLAVPQISSGDTDYAAAALFLQSARRRQPNFEIAPADVPHLAAICRLVEGMPLALELAASRLEMLSLREIAAEIQKNLDFLQMDVRNVPERHRSMQAVFDASWLSLSEEEKRIYAQLSVFRGGFTKDAAKVITGAVPQTLGGLVNKSLLRISQPHNRYEIHELLRQYAAEQLGDDGKRARDQHTDFYCDFLQRREADLKGLRQREALAEIEADGENARAAYQWAVERSQVAQLEKALDPLALFYHWHSRLYEGEAMCRLAAEKLAAPLFNEENEVQGAPWAPKLTNQAPFLVKVLIWQSLFSITLSQYGRARQSLQRAQILFDKPDLRAQKSRVTNAFLLLQLSKLAMVDDFGKKAVALGEQSLDLYRSAGDSWGMAMALDMLSQQYMNQGLHEKALQLQEECLAIRQRLNDQLGIARSYNVLGLLVLHKGQIETSEVYLRKSLSLFHAMDNRTDRSSALAVLGINLLFAGKFKQCIATYEECWTIHRELSLPREPFLASVTMTRAKINLGRYDEARAQADADLVRYRTINHSWSIAFSLFNLGRLDLVKNAASRARQLLQESAEILTKMNERSLLPDVLFCLAYAFQALGEQQQARQTMIQALRMVLKTGPLNPMRFELPGMALLLAEQGENERAVEFYAASLQSPYIANSRWFEDIAGGTIAEAAAALPQDVVMAAQERGQKRDLWLTVNDLLAELSKIDKV